jgi:three-Cys-motif partner protein|tara:strand:- start:4723 stop:5568 length:846 start_codon:yes stop_codon:yes gene_type:complete
MKESRIAGKIPRQITKWACHKLECFNDYIEAYTKILGSSDCCYLELFAGCGSCTCKGTDCLVDGSELRASKTRFSQCVFVVKDNQDAENLKRLVAPFGTKNAIIIGNLINDNVMRQAFDFVPRSKASFAFINPPGYRMLRWSSIKKLAMHGSDWKGHKIELLIILPLEMALLRNLARPECEASINRLFGNQKWQLIRQERLSGKIEADEVRKKLVVLFKAGLKSLGYRYIKDFKPARFTNPPYYHLIWASDMASRAKMLGTAWSKERYLPCELFHSSKGQF